ncbi:MULTISPECIES: competence/damage-inducible protein A [Clostridium]|mgnify:CR=1 FL=1|uniref:Putative competence-damage inducible protein n=2 Tax=Clostridium TaxID=1485 RepID=A0A151AMF8_9CLOT|nr:MULTISPECIES: competence/damage-inducible protein A [Clostridium]KYH28720.1 putative competence-damage inducible protein [Clostridium colicanis DSM 13634]MBE6044951.1 competence/damage-inducible protein A [Clostridium thermopalmarium]PRR76983.1 putative competence-damage inducible protein [Clostridium thermopalmarium DSM 5974]PVZ21208.1 nicotinamide-nucleotide amidase [Clostridium thermopalmarium DSM 5974]
MRAEILAVGTEILLGNIVNTNAQYIANRLAELGIEVYHQSVVGDNAERLMQAYDLAFKRADLVITTGGLGPTKDDLTKEVAFEYFGKKAVLHEELLKEIEDYFKKINMPMSENNKKQAFFPEDAIIMKNKNGTAPGCIIEEGNKILAVLPGPPREMKLMFEESLVPYLKKFQDSVLVSKTLRVIGLGESNVAEIIDDILENSKNPTVAPYAKEGQVTLRITAKAENEEEGKKLIISVEKEIRERLGISVYGEGDITLEEVVGKILVENNLTIATAESCTGGLLGGAIINYPGISKVFKEGFITYSNEAKIKRLNVSEKTLKNFGAVSSETAAEMAKGAALSSGSDIGISTTGIAGPGGGTKEKPVGLVYVGLYIKGEVKTKELHLVGNRQRIRNMTVMRALDWLRRELISRYI